jgi:hypothetical protein
MFRLNQSKEAGNPALALEHEVGTFLVWGPSGAVERYECVPGKSIESIEFIEQREPRSTYLITKIAELSNSVTETGSTSHGVESRSRTAGAR